MRAKLITVLLAAAFAVSGCANNETDLTRVPKLVEAAVPTVIESPVPDESSEIGDETAVTTVTEIPPKETTVTSDSAATSVSASSASTSAVTTTTKASAATAKTTTKATARATTKAVTTTTKTVNKALMDILSPRERLGLDPEPSPKWVTSLPQAKNAKQLFIVAAYDKNSAWISMHRKDSKGNWTVLMSTPGFIGENGLGKTRVGDKRTPQGVFSFNRAFGIADDPGCAIPYVKVDDSIYWSGDGRIGMHYNELVDIDKLPGLNKSLSEHIIDYTFCYQYCLNISYNPAGIPALGSAIFLHCIGQKSPFTYGCVAIPEDTMRFVMKNVSPDCVVIINSMTNLGASF